MKILAICALAVLTAAASLGYAEQATEVEQLKADLIGHTMGGRERSWQFQSVEQIKELVIRQKTEDARQRIYDITLELQDPRAPGKYKAEARVQYTKTDTRWHIASVGLISLVKIE
jgi:hypothetical protein